MSASTVFEVGSRMSISRLCVRISNCSRESFVDVRGADHAELLDRRRQRYRARHRRPRPLRRLHDLHRRLVQNEVFEGPVAHVPVPRDVSHCFSDCWLSPDRLPASRLSMLMSSSSASQ